MAVRIAFAGWRVIGELFDVLRKSFELLPVVTTTAAASLVALITAAVPPVRALVVMCHVGNKKSCWVCVERTNELTCGEPEYSRGQDKWKVESNK